MCRIPYTVRINGRYLYRRRIHFRNLISRPLSLAMQTAEPGKARIRAALLSARFVRVKQHVEAMLVDDRAFLTGAEIERLFRQELEQELASNLGDAFRNAPYSSSVAEVAECLAEAYRIARRPDRPRKLTHADEGELKERGVLPGDVRLIDEYLREFCHDVALDDETVTARLAGISVTPNPALLDVARGHLLRARAEAWRRTQHVFDSVVMDAPDPVAALLDLPLIDGTQLKCPLPAEGPPAPAAPTETSPFAVYDKRRFSQIIDEIIAQLKDDKVWTGDCLQQRRILKTFAWITGDKSLGDYNHLDVERFKRGLMRLPKTFQFGSMAMPFATLAATLPPVPSTARRHAKTVNRDLSTMSRVSRHLAQTVWKATTPNTLVLDFAAATLAVRDTGDDPRPPWRKEHLALLFGSPLYTGNSGPLHRLTANKRNPTVYHDAAYWVPLLCYYHHTCREETCGLRVDEVIVDHDVPHFVIQSNDIRGRDGELKGEKRLARRRALPLHPELIRLGFLDYVSAIRSEGHAALFPELYLTAGKRGGAQFYARAWTHIFGWIEARMFVPRNKAGKGPDIHSIRALGSSFYEVDGVNEIMRADVMGHARTTVNGKHYSKRLATEGLHTVLQERLAFICRYVPIITHSVPAAPLRLLPLQQRSRVGNSNPRKPRSDRHQGR